MESTDGFGGNLKFGGVVFGFFPPIGFWLCPIFEIECMPLPYRVNEISMIEVIAIVSLSFYILAVYSKQIWLCGPH